MAQYMNDGSYLVSQLQGICHSLTAKTQKSVKIEQKSRKGENFIAKLIGSKSKEPKVSQSYQDKLLSQQEQMKREQEQ